MSEDNRNGIHKALELLERDRELDDEIFTPPAAIGMAVNLGGSEEDGGASSSVPRKPIDPSNTGSATLRVTGTDWEQCIEF